MRSKVSLSQAADKVRVARGFDRLAASYDRLARLVFGASIHLAQRKWLDQIPSGSRVLWIGGGTGELLPEVLSRCADGTLTYVELSPQMIALAQKRRLRPHDQARVHWVLGDEQALPAEAEYDVVLTFFFLDLFAPVPFEALMHRLDGRLRPGGRWLWVDFLPQKGRRHWWQRMLLRLMYWGFRWACGISGKQELPFDQAFA
jgi:ubiquinone/menaquinone biosynthesis C-methylase UbiE